MFLNVYFDLIILISNEKWKTNIGTLVNHNAIDSFRDVMAFALKCIYANSWSQVLVNSTKKPEPEAYLYILSKKGYRLMIFGSKN